MWRGVCIGTHLPNVYVLLPDIRGVSEVDLDAINGSDFDA